MTDDRMCNRCGEEEQVADWGVCAECFSDDCERIADEILGNDE